MVNMFFILVAKDIIFNPLEAWESIDSENKSVNVIIISSDFSHRRIYNTLFA